LIAISGSADTNIPIAGGQGGRFVTGALPPVADVIAKWRARDGCAPPSQSAAPPVTTETSACPHGRAVEWIVIAGAGHQWPGSDPLSPAALAVLQRFGTTLDPPSTALDATRTLWEFFATKTSDASPR